MPQAWVDIPVEGGSMAVFHATPEQPGRGGLVMLQEIFGVNPAMQEKARSFAAEGYTVAVPDLFWRLQPRVSLGYEDPDRTTAFGYLQKLDFGAAVRDIAATARWLAGQVQGKVGAIGFCLGGKLAVAATAAYPFAAVASFYGVKLEDDPVRLGAVTAPLQVHVGDRDAHVPMEAVGKIQRLLAGRPNAHVHVYPGAQHGFFNARRPEVYSGAASREARQRALDMFAAALR